MCYSLLTACMYLEGLVSLIYTLFALYVLPMSADITWALSLLKLSWGPNTLVGMTEV